MAQIMLEVIRHWVLLLLQVAVEVVVKLHLEELGVL
jgi:hypothetical protein